jgi:signal transduction histidine kinase
MNNNIFEKSYYRVRIILTFSAATIIILVIISMVSYNYTRSLYLNQLSEQVNVVSKMLSEQIDGKYLDVLSLGLPTKSAQNYFREIFNRNKNESLHSEIFIFDKNFDIIVHSDSNITPGTFEPGLLINLKEINALHAETGTVSIPFKGNDGKWYMWGFHRLNSSYWLAVRENAARLKKVEQLSTIYWAFGLGGTVLTIVLAWFMAGSITKPVNKLVYFSSEIGKGIFNASVPANIHGEINILAQAMERMKTGLAKNQKEKEDLLAQIAHEIRNPLGGIELLANLTKEDLQKEKKDTGYLDKILKELNHLKLLIASYLNYSRPIIANPGMVDLSKISKEIENIFDKQLRKKDAGLVFICPAGKILFDEDHLRQILINLISNSLESICEKGVIKISTETINHRWVINIKDNGTGVPEENLDNIFNPFFTTKKEGTGLGLAISKKLCSENNAELIVKNNSDKGSTFSIIKEIVDA